MNCRTSVGGSMKTSLLSMADSAETARMVSGVTAPAHVLSCAKSVSASWSGAPVIVRAASRTRTRTIHWYLTGPRLMALRTVAKSCGDCVLSPV